jgi:hypothetical protein
MPLVLLTRVNEGGVVVCRPGVLLQEGERYVVYCPRHENELIRGMTEAMLNELIGRGYLTLAELRTADD